MYYLQSRYYDPEVGRFINADALVSTGQGVLGNNMFAYCNNNPVIRSDPAGTFGTLGLSVLGAVLGAVVGYAGEVYENYCGGATGVDAWTAGINWGGVAASAFSGAISAIPGSGLVSATLDVVGSAIIENGINCLAGQTWNSVDVLTDIACNTIGAGAGALLSKLPILNTGLEVPRFIRDIKDDARGIFSIKGKKNLEVFLGCMQALVTTSNAFLNDAIGRATESKFKNPIKTILQGGN